VLDRVRIPAKLARPGQYSASATGAPRKWKRPRPQLSTALCVLLWLRECGCNLFLSERSRDVRVQRDL
jgi:hypothetical protein